MQKEQYKITKSLFEKYISGFSQSKEKLVFEANIQLKYTHTNRVCNLLNTITDNLKMNTSDKLISLIIGLLHDIGRFYQIQLHQTFSDSTELNHAELGVKLIKEHSMLSHLPEYEQNIIYYSIIHHNLRLIPADIPEHIKPFLFLIRDADKLDIIKVALDHFKAIKQQKNSKLNNIICEVSLEEYCSQKVIDDVLNNKTVSFTDIQTIYDEMLMHLSWIETLNYKSSVKYFIEAGYIDFIISILPKETTLSGVGEYIKSIISKYDIKITNTLIVN